jgi:translation initiation factor IF-2
MNISTLAKILGTSINELRSVGQKQGIKDFFGRNTRITYNSAIRVTEIIKPEKLSKIKDSDDDKIYIPSNIIVSEFAETIAVPLPRVIKTLVLNGVIATMNESIDFDTASLIAEELGVEIFPEEGDMFEAETNTNLIKTVEYGGDKKEILRPPVITVMGHVDHGKTTLLDTIRKTNVVAGEAGAITQHISSYKIEYLPDDKGLQNLNLVKGKKGYKLTFIDTPGHEAFTAMRARGSQLADIIILMVSAVEGPKPQTVEVIERAKISKTNIIVALNKTDLPESDPERVKGEIAQYGLVPEEWGGNVPFIEISAKTGTNIDKLLENILIHSEHLELKGQIDCLPQAVVVESHLDTQLGVVSTVLVIKDKLKVGDIIRCGTSVSKIRKMEDSSGKMMMEAGLSDPVMLLGLSEVAGIGEPIIVYKSQKDAINAANVEKLKNSKKVISGGQTKATDNQINIILKADVSGSLEALKEAIMKIPQDKVRVVVKNDSVGEISESDIEFAKVTGSTILAFHTSYNTKIEGIIRKEGITVFSSDIIYEILHWVEEEILKNTKHETKIIVLGKAEILATFKAEKNHQQVFGGEVLEGKVLSNKELRVVRAGQEIGKLEIIEIQKNKAKTTEVFQGQQFGICTNNKVKIQKGDIVECIDEVLVK